MDFDDIPRTQGVKVRGHYIHVSVDDGKIGVNFFSSRILPQIFQIKNKRIPYVISSTIMYFSLVEPITIIMNYLASAYIPHPPINCRRGRTSSWVCDGILNLPAQNLAHANCPNSTGQRVRGGILDCFLHLSEQVVIWPVYTYYLFIFSRQSFTFQKIQTVIKFDRITLEFQSLMTSLKSHL